MRAEAAPGSSRRRSVPARGLGLALAGLLVILVVAGAVAWLSGWRAHSMTTPSMGTAAPVGSLVLSRPVNVHTVRRGQIIVFHPPGRPDVTFAHRVVATSTGPGGVVLRTKGDINPTPDAWTLQGSDLIGSEVAILPDLGFLLQALPLLLMGTFLILLFTSGVPPRLRAPLRIAGGAILVAVLILYLHPLERVALLDEQINQGHGIATVVPTGILPVRVSAVGGSTAVAAPGQTAIVHLSHVGLHHVFQITTSIHLSGWWWLTLLAWTVPLFVGLRQTRRAPEPEPVPVATT